MEMNEMEISLPIAPSSLDPLPDSIRHGMIALGVCGLVSLSSAVSFLLIFTYRMIHWRKVSPHPVVRTQVFMLIYNLFIADIIQASSFVISFWWISQNNLVGPSLICDTQGYLIQIGDVASGLWALAIAVHTFVNVIGQRTVTYQTFVTLMILLWTLIIVLAAIGPLKISENYFVPAGAWCWVNGENDAERLYLHYIWIFISELGSVALYSFMFFYLRFRMKMSIPSRQAVAHSATSSTSSISCAISRVKSSLRSKSFQRSSDDINLKAFSASRTYILKSSRHMIVYTFAYVTLTLPLAVGRALSMANIEPPIEFFITAGILMACSGFVDVILYVGTRRLLVTSRVSRENIDVRNGSGTQPLVDQESEGNEMVLMTTDLKENKSEASMITSRESHDEDQNEMMNWRI